MKRRSVYFLTLALIVTFVFSDVALAKKKQSRPSRSSKARGKEARGKIGRAKVSRLRDRKAVSRRAKGGRSRYARRRGRNRYEAQSRADRQVESQESSQPPARSVASGIPTERVFEIQNALIKSGHLQEPASGQYDEATSEAMKRFQTFNGLPATGLPSAHTLKKLGVSKRSNDGYAMPVKSVSESEKKP